MTEGVKALQGIGRLLDPRLDLLGSAQMAVSEVDTFQRFLDLLPGGLERVIAGDKLLAVAVRSSDSDSDSSKCSRNTSKAAPLAAYTVGRETPEERLSPAIPPQSSCPASAFATHSIFWEVVRGVQYRLVMGCSLRLIEGR